MKEWTKLNSDSSIQFKGNNTVFSEEAIPESPRYLPKIPKYQSKNVKMISTTVYSQHQNQKKIMNLTKNSAASSDATPEEEYETQYLSQMSRKGKTQSIT